MIYCLSRKRLDDTHKKINQFLIYSDGNHRVLCYDGEVLAQKTNVSLGLARTWWENSLASGYTRDIGEEAKL
tara:strand:+ start:1178 stop:1393 length:216 start_codon:yes stop_codon:yes gene_type:complete